MGEHMAVHVEAVMSNPFLDDASIVLCWTSPPKVEAGKPSASSIAAMRCRSVSRKPTQAQHVAYRAIPAWCGQRYLQTRRWERW